MEEGEIFFKNLDVIMPKIKGLDILSPKRYNILSELNPEQIQEIKEFGFSIQEIQLYGKIKSNPIYLDSKIKPVEYFLKGVSEINFFDFLYGTEKTIKYCEIRINEDFKIDPKKFFIEDALIIGGIQSLMNYHSKKNISPKNREIDFFKIEEFLLTFNSPILEREYFNQYCQILLTDKPNQIRLTNKELLEDRIGFSQKIYDDLVNKTFN